MSEQQQSPEEEQLQDAANEASDDANAAQSDVAEQSHQEVVGLLEDARSKADEHWNLYLRTQAEMDNLRKRAERDVQNAHKFGVEKLIGELLPVIDSMEMGLNAADTTNEAVATLAEGMGLTMKMFADALQKAGISPIDPQGEAFNPDFHQAMSMQETADVDPNTVIAVMQKGYLLNERLVRPAMVVVSKAPAGE